MANRLSQRSWRGRVAARCLVGGLALLLSGISLPSASAAPSKSPVVVESISFLGVPGFDEVASSMAYFKYINAHGGVGGHPLQLVQCYIGTFPIGNPDEANSCAQKAVADHVTAVVNNFTAYDSTELPILAPAHIASFGNFPMSNIDNTDPDSYPLIIPGTFFAAGLSLELVQEGHCKKIAALGEAGLPTTAEEIQAVDSGTQYSGAKVAPAVQVSSTEVDLAPTVAKIESEGADCIADLDANTASVALVKAVHESGQSLKIAGIGPSFSPGIIKALGSLANGLYVDQTAQEGGMVLDAKPVTPQEKTFYQVMQRYAPSDIADGNSEWPGYAAASGFVVVAKYMAAHNIPFTASKFQATIPKVQINTGFFPTVSFAHPGRVPGYRRIENTYVNYLEVKNGSLVAIDNNNISVAPALIKFPRG